MASVGSACPRHDLEHQCLDARRSLAVRWHSAGWISRFEKLQPGDFKVIRAAEDTRPLSLKLAANKAVMSTTAPAHGEFRSETWQPTLSMRISEMRLSSIEASWSDRPCAMALDLTAAFPSISRQWLRHVLQSAGASIGLRALGDLRHRARLGRCTALGLASDTLFEMWSGVQQAVIFCRCSLRSCLGSHNQGE